MTENKQEQGHAGEGRPDAVLIAELDIGGFRTSLIVRRGGAQVAHRNVFWRGDVVEAADQALTELGYRRAGGWGSAGTWPCDRQITHTGGWYTAPVIALPD